MRPKLSIAEINQMMADTDWTIVDALVKRDTATRNRSMAHMGLTPSQFTKDKIRAALKGRPVVVVTCPHCGKTGGLAAMHRWHFNACVKNESFHRRQPGQEESGPPVAKAYLVGVLATCKDSPQARIISNNFRRLL